jgi:hypothetical protein
MRFGKNPFYVKMHNLLVHVFLYGKANKIPYISYNVGGANITEYGPVYFNRDNKKEFLYYIVNDDTVNIEINGVAQHHSEGGTGAMGGARNKRTRHRRKSKRTKSRSRRYFN